LMDVLYLGLPCVVLIRSMLDKEQDIHLKQLKMKTKGQLLVFKEDKLNHEDLLDALKNQILNLTTTRQAINLDGAATAAKHLARFI